MFSPPRLLRRGYLITMFPGALLANRFTAHNEALAGVLAVSCVLTGISPLAGCDYRLAAAARVGIGAAQGPLFPLISGLFGQWVKPDEYSRANAFVCEGSNLGVLVAYPVTSLLCEWLGYRASFFGPALAGAPCLVLLLLFGSSTPGSNRWITQAEVTMLHRVKKFRAGKVPTVVRVRYAAMLSQPVVLVMTLNWFGCEAS